MRIKTKDIDALVDRLGSMGIDDDFTSDAEIEPTKPFRFLDLPYELRLCVYELLLVFPKTVDLDPSNYRAVKPCLNLFYVNRHIYKEATRAFYSRNTFRVFPIHGRFFHAKYPLLARLPAKYRAHITKLELRLGPGWTKPPKCWVINNKLGLADAVNIRQLRIFVECDPASHDVFEGFRVGEDFYTEFCLDLLRNLVTQAPGINEIEFDAYPSVSKSSPLLQGLVDEAKAKNIAITWGPERGWEKIVDIDLVNVLQKMGLDAGGLLKLP